MNKNNIPQVDEIVGLLNNLNKPELQKLQERNIGNPILDIGIICGDKTEDEIELRLEVLNLGIASINKKCEDILPILRKRIKLLGYLQFISQIVITISGASLIATLEKDGFITVKYISAFLALIGGLITMFVQFKSGTLAEQNLIKTYLILTNYQLDAESIAQEASILKKFADNEDEKEQVVRLIKKGNDLCRKFKQALITII